MTTEAQRQLFDVTAEKDVTVASMVESKIVSDEDIQSIASQLNRMVEEQGCRKLLLDFDKVVFLSSAALGKLIQLKRKIVAVGGKLKLCGIRADLLEAFRITHLDSVFEIHKDRATALARF